MHLRNIRNLNCQKKRKFSITKSNIITKNNLISNGRLSIDSQASTFSSKTHYSNEKIDNKTSKNNLFGLKDNQKRMSN